MPVLRQPKILCYRIAADNRQNLLKLRIDGRPVNTLYSG